jgi:hypothetical protein
MDARSLYEFIEALASGGRDAAAVAGAAPSPFIPHGRSLGRHYLFALAVTADPGQLALEMAGGQHADPGLVKWAAAQTERITSDFAERGWPLIVRVSPPQRLREMLSSPPVLGDVRELDGFLAEVASRHETPVTMLRATLAVRSGEEPGLRIAISDRSAGRPLARAVYRLVGAGAEAGAYRVAVRLASAGVELVAAEESLLRVVQRALALTDEPEPAEVASRDRPESGSLRPGTMRSRFSRPTRHP